MHPYVTARKTQLSTDGLYPRPRGNSETKKLAASIIFQALRDALMPSKSEEFWEFWQKDALNWFFSEELNPGSFRWCADIIDLDIFSVRKWFLKFREAKEEDRRRMLEETKESNIGRAYRARGKMGVRRLRYFCLR